MLSRTLKDGFRANEQRTIVLLLVCRGGATRERRKARPDAQHGWLSVGSFGVERAQPVVTTLNGDAQR